MPPKKKKKKNFKENTLKVPSKFFTSPKVAVMTPLSDQKDFLEFFIKYNRAEVDSKDALINFQQEEFFRAFQVKDEEICLLLELSIGKYIENPAIAYHLLTVAFRKYRRTTDNVDYFLSLALILKLTLNVSGFRGLVKKIFYQLVIDDSLPLSFVDKANLIVAMITVLKNMKTFLEPNIAERAKRLIEPLGNCLDYLKFLANLYSDNKPRVPVEMEIIFYMAYKQQHKKPVSPHIFDDYVWLQVYLFRYQFLDYDFKFEAEKAEAFAEFMDDLRARYLLSNYDCGLILAWLGFSHLRDDAEQIMCPVNLAEAQEILRKIVKEKFKMEEDHLLVNKIPDYILFVKRRLEKNKDKVAVNFDRKGNVSLLVDVLRNLYQIGNNAAGLMLAKLATQRYRLNPTQDYGVEFKEAMEIVNNLLKKNYESEKCHKIIDAIRSFEAEILPNTDKAENLSSTDTDNEIENANKLKEKGERIRQLRLESDSDEENEETGTHYSPYTQGPS